MIRPRRTRSRICGSTRFPVAEKLAPKRYTDSGKADSGKPASGKLALVS